MVVTERDRIKKKINAPLIEGEPKKKRNSITRFCCNFNNQRATYAVECKLWSISDKVTSQLINIAQLRLQCRSCIKLADFQAVGQIRDSFMPDKCSVCLFLSCFKTKRNSRDQFQNCQSKLRPIPAYAQNSCSEIIYLLRKHQF